VLKLLSNYNNGKIKQNVLRGEMVNAQVLETCTKGSIPFEGKIRKVIVNRNIV
jgi:hypothetical protein